MTVYTHACLNCGGAVELAEDLDGNVVLRCVNCAFTIDSTLAKQMLLKKEKMGAA